MSKNGRSMGFGVNLTQVGSPGHSLIGWGDVNATLTPMGLSLYIYKMGTRFSSCILE